MIYTYDSLDVTIIANEVITTGLADGDACTIGQNGKVFQASRDSG